MMSTAAFPVEPRAPESVTRESSGQDKTALPSQGRLGEELVASQLISDDELERALEQQAERGGRLGQVLVDLGLLVEEQILPFLSRHLGVPAVRLREGLLDPEVVGLIPKQVAQRFGALAMFKVRDTLCVAMEDPSELQHIDEIERISQLHVRPVFAFGSSISRVLERAYDEGFQVAAVTADFEESSVELQEDLSEFDITSIENVVDGSPVINLVNYLILHSIRKHASDIHVEPGQNHSVVRFRIDGQLVEMLRPRRDMHSAITSRIKVMGKLDIAEQRMPQDGRCHVIVDGKGIDLRISTLPTVLGEKVVLRVLDKSRLSFDLGKLGLAGDDLTEVKTLMTKPHGLLLVTGPTGSGKTTTLYSALELIKSVHRNIVTVEDPVEYRIDLINQVQVDKARSLTFSGALRSILRQDPDVIMVGEIRDAETARVAVQAALTGHLVLSTAHTNDCAGAIARLIDMDVEPYKIAAALIGVIAQRLVRNICPKCRVSYFPTKEFLDTVHYKGDVRHTFARGEGCRECFDTGYRGRTGIYELMPAGKELREMISRHASLEEIRTCSRAGGHASLLENGLRLAEENVTSLEEVARMTFVE